MTTNQTYLFYSEYLIVDLFDESVFVVINRHMKNIFCFTLVDSGHEFRILSVTNWNVTNKTLGITDPQTGHNQIVKPDKLKITQCYMHNNTETCI